MSAPSPIATKREKPMPRRLAQSSTAAPSAPDCDTKAILPATAPMCVKLALSRAAGDSKPRLPGPRMRISCGLAAASIASLTLPPPLALTSPSPAVMTMAARVPRAQRCEQARDRVARRAQYCQLRRRRQRRHPAVTAYAEQRVVLGIDRPQRAAVAAVDQIGQHPRADALRLRRRADHRHRARIEQMVQITYAHGAVLLTSRFPDMMRRLPARRVVLGHAGELRDDAFRCIRSAPDPAAEGADGLQVAAGGDHQVLVVAPRAVRREPQFELIIFSEDMPARQRIGGVVNKVYWSQPVHLPVEPQRVFVGAKITGLQIETQFQSMRRSPAPRRIARQQAVGIIEAGH